jgi:plasmid maintenance system antidote protein VapI
MLMTKRSRPAVGGILIEEFMEPMSLTHGVLAKRWGLRKTLTAGD